MGGVKDNTAVLDLVITGNVCQFSLSQHSMTRELLMFLVVIDLQLLLLRYMINPILLKLEMVRSNKLSYLVRTNQK